MVGNLVSATKPKYKFTQAQLGKSLFLFAFLGNLAYILLFLSIGYSRVAFLTFPQGLAFLYCFFASGRRHTKLVALIGSAAIIYSSFCGDLIFGWSFGSHYYLLCAIPLLIATENLTNKFKHTLYFVFICSYFGFHHLLYQAAPLLPLPGWLSPYIGEIQLFAAFTAVIFSMTVYSFAVTANEKTLNQLNIKMEQMANTDELTELPNRRCVMNILDNEVNNLGRYQNKTTIGLVDVDDFKNINDTHGHHRGDDVLKAICVQMRESLRQDDFVGRWGGEEFIILLPDTDLLTGGKVIDRMREAVAVMKLPEVGDPARVTITAGLAEYTTGSSIQEVITLADKHLYQGKRNGKNCTVVGL